MPKVTITLPEDILTSLKERREEEGVPISRQLAIAFKKYQQMKKEAL
jgi:hypothetical protein